jgi:hypothetical protein
VACFRQVKALSKVRGEIGPMTQKADLLRSPHLRRGRAKADVISQGLPGIEGHVNNGGKAVIGNVQQQAGDAKMSL